MARSRWDLGYSRLWLVEDLWWVLFAKMISTSQPVVGLGWRTTLFFQLFAQLSLYNTRIWTVMARSICNLGNSRILCNEDLQFISFSQMISTSQPVVGLGWRTALFFPLFGQISVQCQNLDCNGQKQTGFRLQQVMAGSRPLAYFLFIDDITIIACCWSWMENHTLFPAICLAFSV